MDFVLANIWLITLAVSSGVMFFWLTWQGSSAKNISPSEATLLINRDALTILDVREATEFAVSHLPEAKNLPLSKIPAEIAPFAALKDQAVLLYCASGGRSTAAAHQLKRQGFTQLYNLDGGIDAWINAGFPTKKGKK